MYYRNRFSLMIFSNEPDKTDLVLTSSDFQIDFWKLFIDFAS